jgi:anaerobic glycerol-3-phosphate dehydrogenase
VLRRVAAELGLTFDRLRADPTGLRDVDLQELVDGWPEYNRPDLLRAYLRSIAHRLALDRLPAINERAA